MNIVFLGTNGWFDTPTGNTTCILIETDKVSIILDAGNGLFKVDRYIGKEKPVFLFISHTHLDHIIGLHLLNKFEFNQGLTICGQPGIKAALLTLFMPPYSLPFTSLTYPVEILEVDCMYENSAFNVETAQMVHSVSTIGFRFSIENKIITYCPDTGYCDNAVKLARDSDLLIAECAYRSGEESEQWPHLNPQSAAQIAVEAKVKQLALVHFDAYRYQTMESRHQAQQQSQTIFKNTVATKDGEEIEL
jgi:ribonuclease BN (tRNA processing enzyme)